MELCPENICVTEDVFKKLKEPPPNCIDVIGNTVPHARDYANIKGVRHQVLYFSAYCKTREEVVGGQWMTWPSRSGLPIIISDRRTVDERLSKGCPEVNMNKAGDIESVHLLPLETEKEKEASTKCVRCGKCPSSLTCKRCKIARFCSANCRKEAKKETHSRKVCVMLTRDNALKQFSSVVEKP
jgi:hypothetical protein